MAELVEHVGHPIVASIVGAILDEVIGPDIIALLRPRSNARSVGQPGAATEELNRSWYERNTGWRVGDVQRRVKRSAIPWIAETSTASWRTSRPMLRVDLAEGSFNRNTSRWAVCRRPEIVRENKNCGKES
jgi:hypothetical protein